MLNLRFGAAVPLAAGVLIIEGSLLRVSATGKIRSTDERDPDLNLI